MVEVDGSQAARGQWFFRVDMSHNPMVLNYDNCIQKAKSQDTGTEPARVRNQVVIAGQVTSVTRGRNGLRDYCLLSSDFNGAFVVIRNIHSSTRVELVPVLFPDADITDFPDITKSPPVFLRVNGSIMDFQYQPENCARPSRALYVLASDFALSVMDNQENSVSLVGSIDDPIKLRPSRISAGGYSVVSIDRERIVNDLPLLEAELARLPASDVRDMSTGALEMLGSLEKRNYLNDNDQARTLIDRYGDYFEVIEIAKQFINFRLSHTIEGQKPPFIRVALLATRADYAQRYCRYIKKNAIVLVEGTLNSDFFEGHTPSVRLKVFAQPSGFHVKLPRA